MGHDSKNDTQNMNQHFDTYGLLWVPPFFPATGGADPYVSDGENPDPKSAYTFGSNVQRKDGPGQGVVLTMVQEISQVEPTGIEISPLKSTLGPMTPKTSHDKVLELLMETKHLPMKGLGEERRQLHVNKLLLLENA